MTAAASTLRTYPVGGQLDPAWLASSVPWTHVRATATLARPDDGSPVVDPTNGAHEHPTTVTNQLTAAQSGGQWATAPLKPTTATGADLALTPSGLTWEITLEIKRGATWHEVITYTVAPSGDRDYSGLGETITVAGTTCTDVNALIPPPTSLPPSSIFEDAVLDVLAANPQVGHTDLTVSRTSTTVTVASSTGDDATLPAATTSLAGQLTAADKAKLDGIEAGAIAVRPRVQVVDVTLSAVPAADYAYLIHNMNPVLSVDLFDTTTGKRVAADWGQTAGAPTSDIAIEFGPAATSGAYIARVSGVATSAATVTQYPYPSLFHSAALWYDAHDLTAGAQTLASRAGTGTATLGSGATSDSSDPTIVLSPIPHLLLDGTDDYLQLPTGDKPTVTATTGARTDLLILQVTSNFTTVNQRMWSTEASANSALQLRTLSSSTSFYPAARLVTPSGAMTTGGAVAGVAVVVNSGALFGWSSVSGSTTTADITSAGTITHAAPRIGSPAYTVTPTSAPVKLFAVVSWNSALSTSALSSAASYLIGTFS